MISATAGNMKYCWRKSYNPSSVFGIRAVSAARGPAPPEDCGGTGGYENFLAAIRDPRHEEHDEYLEWIGGEFDPEDFELAEFDTALRHIR